MAEWSAPADKLVVSKLEAARRQLATAIRLWFMEEDPVAIHTLLAASHEIIHTLHRRMGGDDLLFDSFLIKDEYRTEWVRRVKSHANFFKHADKDPDGTVEFTPRINEMLILFCLKGLSDIGASLGVEERLFNAWLMLHRPELLKEGVRLPVADHILEEMRSRPKQDWIEVGKVIAAQERRK